MNLTIEQKDFLQHHEIDERFIFDATGIRHKDYDKIMKNSGLFFAIGVTPCKKEQHTLRTRKGQCIQCNTANIAFMLRSGKNAYIYIVGSIKGQVLKVGFTKDINDRLKHLVGDKYGGLNDWKLLYSGKYDNALKFESLIHNNLLKVNYNIGYNYYGKNIICIELFKCKFDKIKGIIEENKNSFGLVEDEFYLKKGIEKYDFIEESKKVLNKKDNDSGGKGIKQLLKEAENKVDAYEYALDKLGDHEILGPLNEKLLKGEEVNLEEYLEENKINNGGNYIEFLELLSKKLLDRKYDEIIYEHIKEGFKNVKNFNHLEKLDYNIIIGASYQERGEIEKADVYFDYYLNNLNNTDEYFKNIKENDKNNSKDDMIKFLSLMLNLSYYNLPYRSSTKGKAVIDNEKKHCYELIGILNNLKENGYINDLKYKEHKLILEKLIKELDFLTLDNALLSSNMEIIKKYYELEKILQLKKDGVLEKKEFISKLNKFFNIKNMNQNINEEKNNNFDENIKSVEFVLAYLFLFIGSIIGLSKLDTNADIYIVWFISFIILQIIFIIMLFSRIKKMGVSKFYILGIYSPFSIIYFFKLLFKKNIQKDKKNIQKD